MALENGVLDARDEELNYLRTEVAKLRAERHQNGVADAAETKTDAKPFEFSSIPEVLEAVRAGEFVVVMDDEGRENEGDLLGACSKMTEEKLAFMIRYTSGVICTSIPEAVQKRLCLPMMVDNNTERHCTAFTHTLDYNIGTTTGISAGDRAATCRALAREDSQPEQFNRPGHIFPLVCRPDGVLERPGHTEASSDLCRLAGLPPVGILCEIVMDNGKMARRPDLEVFSAQHGLKMTTIAALVAYRKENNL